MNNSQTTTNSTQACNISPILESIASFLVSLQPVLSPIYIITGLIGNLFLLFGFFKIAKGDRPYVYQILLTVSKLSEIWWFGSYVTGIGALNSDGSGKAPSLMNNVVVMGYLGFLCAILHQVFLVSSPLCTVAMTADRIFALSRPMKYRQIKNAKHQIIAGVVCFIVPLFFSFPQVWRFNLIFENGVYKLKDNPYVKTIFPQVFLYIRVGIRVLAVLVLISLNFCVVRLFRNRVRVVEQMNSNSAKVEARKSANKGLLILTVYQSISICLNQIPHAGWQVIIFIFPTVNVCFNKSILFNQSPFLADSIDLFAILIIQKNVRKMVFDIVKCKV